MGRQAEWKTLRGAWENLADGVGQLVLLGGEAGIGKSRLAEEFLS
ncbi:MAG: AAA family ATPase [Caldilineaceae bacterium]|nr:AAA family ATPase [Caldilineaceae bacterium]